MAQWQWPHVSWTPQLQGIGAWTADGQMLLLQQADIVRGTFTKPTATDTTAPVRLVDTDVPGSQGALLDLRAPASQQGPYQPYLTPDGSEVITTADSGTHGLVRSGKSSGEIAVYSARTGTLIRTLAPWSFTMPGPHAIAFATPDIAWSDPGGTELLVLQPYPGTNRLAVIDNGRLELAGGLLPASPQAYASLQAALRNGNGVPPNMTW